MADKTVLMGEFRDVDATASALSALRTLGIRDQDVTVISSIPYAAHMLGRPPVRSILPRVSLFSAITGFLTGLFFTVGTPLLYRLIVGGMPLVSTPPTAVLQFEFTMLFLILGTFFGMLFLGDMPTYRPQYYPPTLTAGLIGLLVPVASEQVSAARDALQTHGAATVYEPELNPL